MTQFTIRVSLYLLLLDTYTRARTYTRVHTDVSSEYKKNASYNLDLTLDAGVKDRSPRLAENNYAHPIVRRTTLTTRDNKGDETERGSRGGTRTLKGISRCSLKFIIIVKACSERVRQRERKREGEKEKGGIGGGKRRRRSALFTIFNMQSRYPLLPPHRHLPRLFAARVRARARPDMNKH